MPTGLDALRAMEPAKPKGGLDALRSMEPSGGHMTASGKRVKELSTLDKIFDYINLGGHGLMMGAGDEAQAAMSGLGAMMGGEKFGPAYDKRLGQARTYLDEARDRTGWGGTGAEVGGSLVPAVASMGVGAVAAPASWAARTLGGLAGGGLFGGLSGFAEGEGGMHPRLVNSIGPATLGASLGALGPTVGAGVGRMAASRARRKAAKAGNVPEETVEILQSIMDADLKGTRKDVEIPDGGLTVDLGPKARATLGKLATNTNANVAGDAPVPKDTLASLWKPDERMAEWHIRQRKGSGGSIQQVVDDRVGEAREGLRNALDEAFGKPLGVKSTTDELRETNRPRMTAAYNRAYSQPIDYASPKGMELETFLKTRLQHRPEVIRKAKKMMADEGVESQQLIAKISDDGKTVTIERMPDVREVDYIKRALDDIVKAENAQGGVMGGTTETGKAVGAIVRELRERTDELVPAYGQARRTAAVPAGQTKAMEAAYAGIVNFNKSIDDFAADLRELGKRGDVDTEYLKQGARSAIDHLMSKARDSMIPQPSVSGLVNRQAVGDDEGKVILKQLTSRSMREKIGMILGQKESDKLFAALDNTANAFELSESMVQNVRKQAEAELQEYLDPTNEIIRRLTKGEPLGAASEAGATLLGRGRGATNRRSERQARTLAEVLMSPANPQALKALHRAERPGDAYYRGRRLTELLAARAGIPTEAAMPANLHMQFYGGQ